MNICWRLVLTGGVLFKVYIVGDFVRVVRRYSLPDLQEGESTVSNGIMPFPRVSCAAATISDLDPKAAGRYLAFF